MVRRRSNLKRRILSKVLMLAILIAGITFVWNLAQSAITASPSERAGIPATAEVATLVRVVDGDTVIADIGGVETRVRLIGVDTPETLAPDQPVECFGPEASAFLMGLLPAGGTIYLAGDATQPDVDKYDRALRYLWLPDGTLVQDELLSGGYARLYLVGRSFDRYEAFGRLQDEARKAGTGMWSPGGCAATS